MQSQDIKAFFVNQLEAVKSDFLKDFQAFDASQLAVSPGGSARTPLDLMFECAYVNRRLAKRIKGEEVESWPFGSWAKAPEGYAARAEEDFTSSMDEMIAAWNDLPPDELMRPIVLPEETTHPMDLVWMVCYHTGYHDGQLNYLQSLNGDEKVHW